MIKLDYSTWEQNYKKLPLRVVLDNIQDKNNLGAALRVCDALCVEQLHWNGDMSQDITKKVRRIARGTEKHVPTFFEENLIECLLLMKQDGFTIVAVEITKDSKILQNVDFQSFEKIALVVGAEQEGVSEAILEVCDFAVHIPMYGKGFSMNVTCALSIALYEVTRQKNKQ